MVSFAVTLLLIPSLSDGLPLKTQYFRPLGLGVTGPEKRDRALTKVNVYCAKFRGGKEPEWDWLRTGKNGPKITVTGQWGHTVVCPRKYWIGWFQPEGNLTAKEIVQNLQRRCEALFGKERIPQPAADSMTEWMPFKIDADLYAEAGVTVQRSASFLNHQLAIPFPFTINTIQEKISC